MKKDLIQIYALRMLLLEKINPNFFKENYNFIKKTSLAAQDYVLSGGYYEYDPRTGQAFRKLPEYIKIHKKYKIPYNPATSMLTEHIVHPGLVMDLSWSLKTDMLNGIVDAHGNIMEPNSLKSSEVLHVYHNSSSSGIPVNALQTLTPTQLTNMLSAIKQRTK